MFDRAAFFVDRLLRGGKAGELPVEQPMRFECAANLRTAKTLGIQPPKQLTLQSGLLIQ